MSRPFFEFLLTFSVAREHPYLMCKHPYQMCFPFDILIIPHLVEFVKNFFDFSKLFLDRLGIAPSLLCHYSTPIHQTQYGILHKSTMRATHVFVHDAGRPGETHHPYGVVGNWVRCAPHRPWREDSRPPSTWTLRRIHSTLPPTSWTGIPARPYEHICPRNRWW